MLNEATTITTQTLALRAARFRNFVVAVVAVALAAMLWALLQTSWQPLLGLILLVPLCGAFLYLDARTVHRWQDHILETWAQDKLDLDIFSDTLTAIRALPPRTLRAMLDTLPNLQHTATNTCDDRHALAASLQRENRRQSNRTLIVTLAYTAGLAALALVVILFY